MEIQGQTGKCGSYPGVNEGVTLLLEHSYYGLYVT